MSVQAATEQAQRIQRAFIDGIRTVAIIDDQMFPYHDVVHAKAPPPLGSGSGSALSGDVTSVAPSAPPGGQAAVLDPDEKVVAFRTNPMRLRSGDTDSVVLDPEEEFAPAKTETTPLRSGDTDSISLKRVWAGETEHTAAAALTSDFSGRGWFHDVRRDRFESAHELAGNSDLIILDYYLGNDPDAALRILSKLAVSDRMHLVVLYSREKESKVWLHLVTLFSADPAQPVMDSDEQARFESWYEDEKPAPELMAVARCLAGNMRMPSVPEPAKGKKVAPEPWHERWRVIQAYQEARRLRSSADQERTRLDIKPVDHMEVSSGDCMWVRCGNVFVVVQRKDQPPLSGNKIVERLVSALTEWDPSFLRLMLREARHRFAAQGVGADGKLLRGKHGEAAWLIFANSGSPEERAVRRRTIYNRLFESFVHQMLEAWPSETGVTDPYGYAAGKTGLDAAADREETYFHLNEVLAFEEGIPPYLRTGTVFAIPGDEELIGVCVSPECDLVPRPEKAPKHGGEALPAVEHPAAKDEGPSGGDAPTVFPGSETPNERSQPAVVVLWRALKRTAWSHDKKKCLAALGNAEKLGHLFLRLGTKGDKYVVDLSEARKPNAFFVSNSGRIENGTFSASSVVVGGDGLPKVEDGSPKSYTVIAQLRELYAVRLLHETGHQLSRVGVDFVKLPGKEKTK